MAMSGCRSTETIGETERLLVGACGFEFIHILSFLFSFLFGMKLFSNLLR
jgi:hypothetical protein